MSAPTMAGWNLALRFGLEVAALAGVAVAGWRSADGAWRWLVAIALPVLAAVVWATFNVPDDPSRSGAAPVEVSGATRLVVELAVLGAGTAAFVVKGPRVLGVVLVVLLVVHYAASMPRLEWLIGR